MAEPITMGSHQEFSLLMATLVALADLYRLQIELGHLTTEAACQRLQGHAASLGDRPETELAAHMLQTLQELIRTGGDPLEELAKAIPRGSA